MKEHKPSRPQSRYTVVDRTFLLAAALLLGACGGGGGSDLVASARSVDLAQQCAPQNPFVDDAVEQVTTASLTREKQWMSAYLDEAYLWYRDIPSINAGRTEFSDAGDVYASLENYFFSLLSPYTTASGAPKDRFSFVYPTRRWEELSQSGIELGYGMQLAFNSTPPRNTRVVFVDSGSPASNAGIERGMWLVSVDGVSTEATESEQVAALNAALFAPDMGEVHSFEFRLNDGSSDFVDMAADSIEHDPVPLTRVFPYAGRTVGYILFNEHVATAEPQLIDAVTTLRDAGVDTLVLDLRYNGGGYLYIASQLAYMIAGPARSAGQVFERLQFNDKRRALDQDFLFLDCTSGRDFDCGGVPSLPALDLDRVYVIASAGTCSASEAIVNGLRGIDVDVRLIGGATCGKPYGFSAQDNCGISYFPIEFQGVNAKGFGDYADGLVPDCAANDDLDRALGDPAEDSLKVTLDLATDGNCGTAKSQVAPMRLLRNPIREGRWLRGG